eukprot:CAMPEP_0172528142 /NCGR_PEP_ID=MMETSP1067-20121228/2623_1 /TAXON_ID=265564 ORGANISM="Thalassiosira punctigera, Strain Tpunct2005C2" /NCGR_SAMPLE_ID=MMETSP1067 /ASSEMBLY_ACC=CAM_ASM_000444 /LENGTH=1326 /DNA_ID=CAMNT_0013312005 /DNA_START=164 /DNA_END=4144 /DNA_ORIENTATION=-
MTTLVFDDRPTRARAPASKISSDGNRDNIEEEDEDGEELEWLEEPSTMAPAVATSDASMSHEESLAESQGRAAGDDLLSTVRMEQAAAGEDGKSEGNDGQLTQQRQQQRQHEQQQEQQRHEKHELADSGEEKIIGGGTTPFSEGPVSPPSAPPTADSVVSRLSQRRSIHYSTIFETAKLVNEAKCDRLARRLRERSENNEGDNNNDNATKATRRSVLLSPKLTKTKAAPFSLDGDVAYVDKLLIQTSYAVISCWIFLVSLSYYVVPPESIVWYEGTERNAALVELSILATAVTMKHFPLLWEKNFIERGGVGRRRRGSMMAGRTRIGGILAGGLVTQFIAIMTAVIMVCFPVPVMVDPILGSRVHFIRWCEWIPLAGYMTLMTECIDAPQYDGAALTHQWRTKFTVSAMESISTFCGFLFPFCRDFRLWLSVMVFSCVTYSAIIFRYLEKRKLFRTCVWRGGGSVDEVELYQRARISLSLHRACCVVWTMITVNYFVFSLGPHVVSERRFPALHDPASVMIGECFMDLLAKCLYMALIVEVHYAGFDEARRANRRLAELRETMSVVWENSSDAIAISVRKISGSVTSMVSPSFFRQALLARMEGGRDKIDDISAIILEHDDIAKKTETTTNMSRINEAKLPNVGIKIVRKADFASVDLHSASENKNEMEYLGRRKNDPMTAPVLAFTDMLKRAWQGNPKISGGDFLFEHDTCTLQDQEGSGNGASSSSSSSRTKFEAKATRLEENAVVIVVRNVSERYRRFEAEKRFVFETTARQKDAEANRFTRHEVKNGLLAAIEICGNAREQLSDDLGREKNDGGDVGAPEKTVSGQMENMMELDRTLHEVLDIVLAETMARDVIHEMYAPRMERIDLNHILTRTRGFKANSGQFSVTRKPSPLPILLSDQGLFKCIHGNAIRNALRYGEQGGKISTEATYDQETGVLEVKVINLPGPGHEKLVGMGSRASELVFSHGTRLHKDSDLGKRYHSAGDGAWIIRKCANILQGTVDITFEEKRTTFTFRAPVKSHKPPSRGTDTFHLPRDVWGIAIDDSKIQRKLLRRFLQHAGVPEPRQVILGQKPGEIAGFVDFVVDFVARRPGDRFVLIADENLEMDDDGGDGDNDSGFVAGRHHETISGSKCIKRIRGALTPEQESRVLALVRSANDSPQDLALYESRAHGYMPKVPLRGLSVRETMFPLWERRFPKGRRGAEGQRGDDDSDSDGSCLSRIASIENLRDLTLVSPTEVLVELEQIDALCVPHRSDGTSCDRWCVLWDKLHQLKGDLKSVNVDDKFSTTIDLIETLRGENFPANFMSTWLRIRSDVISFISQN